MFKIIKRVHSSSSLLFYNYYRIFYIPPKCSDCYYYIKKGKCKYFELPILLARLSEKKCGLDAKKFEPK